MSVLAVVALGAVLYVLSGDDAPRALVVAGDEGGTADFFLKVMQDDDYPRLQRTTGRVSQEESASHVRGRIVCATTQRPLSACVRYGRRMVWASADRGTFAINGAVNDIHVVMDGYESQSLSAPWGRDDILLQMRPHHILRTTVIDAMGARLPSAELEVATSGSTPGSARETWLVVAKADADGVAVIPCAGVNVIRAHAGGVYSQPILQGPGDATLVCDATQTCLLELRDVTGAPVEAVIELVALSGASGMAALVRTDERGFARSRVPFGSYAARVLGHGPLVGHREALVTNGRVVDVSTTDPLVLRVARQGEGLQVLSAATGEAVVAARLRVEILEMGRWRPWGEVIKGGADGLLRCGDLWQMLAGLRMEAVRGVLGSQGYADTELTGHSMCVAQVVRLWPMGTQQVVVVLRQESAVFTGKAIVTCLDGDMAELGGRVPYDGARSPSVEMSVPVAAEYIGVYASQVGESDLIGSSRLHDGDAIVSIELPAGGTIRVVDVPDSAGALAVRRSNGVLIDGVYAADGTVRFDGVWPGTCVVGPRDAIVGHNSPPQFRAQVEIAAGQEVAVQWLNSWRASPAINGSVSLAGGGTPPELFVAPNYADRVPAGRGALSHAVRVDGGGRFFLPALSPAPVNLAVYSVLPNGEPVLLGVHEPGGDLRIGACDVTLDTSLFGATRGVVIILVDHGGGKSQHIVPCELGRVMPLGALPMTGVDVQVVPSGGPAVSVDMPSQSGLVRVGPQVR